MRFFIKIILLLILPVVVAVPLLLLGAAALALDDVPLLTRNAEIKPENIARARRIVEGNDPRRMRTGALRSVSLGAEDVDLAANYLANQYLNGSASVALPEGAFLLRGSVPLPANPFGRFVNFDATLVETSHLPRVESLHLGRLPVPALIANRVLDWLIAGSPFAEGAGGAADAVKRVFLRNGMVRVVFEWNENLPAKLRGILVSADDEARLRAYQAGLAQMAGNGSGSLPLEDVVAALLNVAAARGGAAVGENRALLIALAFFVNGKGLGAILPVARDWPQPAPREVTLAGRRDFAQHFSVSAAIAATAGSPLADAIGLYKEVDDARGGSGFSFNDIAADRAGARFGEFAVADADSAARLIARAGRPPGRADFFPAVADLPEFMPESEFRRRFGGVGGVPYRRMMADIEQRIAGLPLYR